MSNLTGYRNVSRFYMPKVLIACPIYDGKEYSIERWIQSVESTTHSPKQILSIDNSKTVDFFNKWRTRIPMGHLDLGETLPNIRIATCMEYIRQKFVESDFDYLLSWECDVLAPPYALSYLLNKAEGFDFTTIPYKSRTKNEVLERSFGFSLFSADFAKRICFNQKDPTITTDAFMWMNFSVKHRVVYGIRLEHLCQY